MKLVCRGKVNEKHFIKAISLLSAIELPKELELYIIDDPKYCREAVHPLPPSQKPIFRRFCNQERASFSYSWGGKEVVLIQISPQNSFITKNLSAAAGLLAHELIHTLLRKRGLDRHLVDCYEANYCSNFKLLRKLKLPKEKMEELFNAVGTEALMALKDLYINSEALSLGLGDYLLEYYCGRLGSLSHCPSVQNARKSFSSEMGFLALRDALRFQLTLLPICVPFNGYKNRKANSLIRKIDSCCKKMGEISREFGAIRALAAKDFSPSCAFHRNYFSLVFLKACKLLI